MEITMLYNMDTIPGINHQIDSRVAVRPGDRMGAHFEYKQKRVQMKTLGLIG